MRKIGRLSRLPLLALALGLALTLTLPAAAGPTLTAGGPVNAASDSTGPDTGTWTAYRPATSATKATGTVGEYASGYWAGEVGAPLTGLAVGAELIAVIERETNPGTTAHAGYYAVMDHALDNTDPALFAATTLRAVPVPNAALTFSQTVALNWSPAAEDTSTPTVAGYDLYRSTDGVGFSRINTDPVTTTQYEDTGFAGGSAYYALALVYRGTPTYRSSLLSANSAIIDAALPPCQAGVVQVDAIQFSGDTFQVRSETAIEAINGVQVAADAVVTFTAPTIGLGTGFRVVEGGRFTVRAEAVSCATATRAVVKLASTGPQPTVQPTGQSAPGWPTRFNAANLPPRIANALGSRGVDVTRISAALLDADGVALVFDTDQGILPEDLNDVSDVYRYEIADDALSLISRSPISGRAGNGPSSYPAIDAMGQWVLFQTDASDLVADDTNGVTDILLSDIWTGVLGSLTLDASHPSAHPSMDAWGEQVVFDQVDDSAYRQILGRETWGFGADETLSLPMDSSGQWLDNHHPGLSPDGRYVVYIESPTDLEDKGCNVHFYDRWHNADVATQCPEGLASEAEQALPQFSVDAEMVLWFIRNEGETIPVTNPLAPSTSESRE